MDSSELNMKRGFARLFDLQSSRFGVRFAGQNELKAIGSHNLRMIPRLHVLLHLYPVDVNGEPAWEIRDYEEEQDEWCVSHKRLPSICRSVTFCGCWHTELFDYFW